MIVAGLGFRSAASPDSLQSALERTGMAGRVSALATVSDKANTPAFRQFAGALKLPVVSIPQASLQSAHTATQSPQARAHRHTGSVAEAAALLGAGGGGVGGIGARLICARVISSDRMATCAIAGTLESVPEEEEG